MSGTQWHIKLFGALKARRGDEEVNFFRAKQAGRLLSYLAARPDRDFRREELIDLLWPSSDLAAGRNSLNVALAALRKLLGESFLLPTSTTGRDRLRINPDAVVTDLSNFEKLLSSANEDTEKQIDQYAAALDMYSAELMPGLEDEWTIGERQRIGDLFLSGVRAIVRLLVDSRRTSEALGYVRKAIQYDPMREELRRLAIQLHCSLGNRSEALREYSELSGLLKREMGAPPSVKTTELFNRLMHPAGGVSEPRNRPEVPNAAPREGRGSALNLMPTPGVSPLFGRDKSVIDLSTLLRSGAVRLVSLTGIGGVGKTRLARAVSDTVSDLFGSDRYYVPLTDVTDVKQINQAILRSMNARRDARTNARNQLIEALHDRPVLLILDNMELLLPSATAVVRSLLDELPRLTCLVTTRQRLNLAAEREVPVAPLDIPSLSSPPDVIMESASVQLFLYSASQASPGFALAVGSAPDLAGICRRLEGLPLAIEMAAAWTRVLAPREILERLKPRLPMLVSRDADASNRHASVRHTLQSSYDMLPDHLQQLFNRLSVFRGGWSAAAAEALSGSCPGAYGTAVVDLMELRDRSLVTVVGESDPIRLTFLELVREFAAERLADSGDRAEACEAHAMFFLNLAESASPHLRGPDAGRWLDALDLEQDNLREALRWTLNGDAPERGSRFAASLWQYWLLRGHIVEGIEWLTKAEARTGTAISSVRARVKLGLGNLSTTAGEYSAASGALNDSLALFQRAGDEAGEADALNGLGNLAFFQGDWSCARGHYEYGLCLNVRLGNSIGEAGVLSNLANVAARTGDADTAMLYFDRSIVILRSNSDTHMLTAVLANSVGTLFLINDLESADERLRECVELSLRDGYPRVLAHSFEGIATVYLKRSRWREATVMFAAAAGIRDRINAPLPESHRANYGGDYDMLRDALGSEAFERAWLQGANMSDDAAAEYCLGRVAAEFDRAHAI